MLSNTQYGKSKLQKIKNSNTQFQPWLEQHKAFSRIYAEPINIYKKHNLILYTKTTTIETLWSRRWRQYRRRIYRQKWDLVPTNPGPPNVLTKDNTLVMMRPGSYHECAGERTRIFTPFRVNLSPRWKGYKDRSWYLE